MLQCVCDLCGKGIGRLTESESRDRDQLKVTMGGKNVFIGDLCNTCYGRLKDFFNLPKETY